MAPVLVNAENIREFSDAEEFYVWLSKNHDVAREVWIKIHKVGSGLASITAKQAIDVALCWGWIDAIRKAHDEKSFYNATHGAEPKAFGAKSTLIMWRGLLLKGA